MRVLRRSARFLIALALVLGIACLRALAQPAAPPLGKYETYLFDPLGNASYAFDFVLLTPSGPGRPGQYELQMGRVPEPERERRGTYMYLPDVKRVQWLTGPFQRTALYQPGETNKVAGQVVERGTSTAR